MSREVKRVPLDFDAPIGKTWAPLLLPEELRYPTCTECLGSGTTATYAWLHSIAWLIPMLADDLQAQKQGKPIHPYLGDLHNRPYITTRGPFGYRSVEQRPSVDARELVVGLTGRDPDPVWGSSGSDADRVMRALLDAAGLNAETWGLCQPCKGQGRTPTPEQVAACEAWSPAEIPVGEGWQLWQTVSEGGPVSPVFPTGEALAWWMSQDGGEFASRRPSYEAALAFVREGWAPSMIDTAATGLVDGVAFAGRNAKPGDVLELAAALADGGDPA